MQIKTSVRHHLAPVRMAILRKMTNSKQWWGCKEKGTLVCRQWECKLVQRYEYGVCFKNRTIWFSSPIPRYLVKDNDNTNSKRYMCPNVHSNTICNCQDIEAAKVSINRWIYREDVGGVVCVCVLRGEYYLAIKNEKLSNHMGGPGECCEVSQTKRDILCYLWPYYPEHVLSRLILEAK